MVSQACIQRVAEVMGESLSRADVDYLANQLSYPGSNVTGAQLAQHSAMLQQRMQHAKVIAKRNAALTVLRHQELMQHLRGWTGKNFHDALEAKIGGTIRNGVGARNSVALRQQFYEGKWLGGFRADLVRDGVWDAFSSDAIQPDIARALYGISRGTSIAHLPQDAQKIARVAHKWMEVARKTQNKLGAWIGKRSDFIVSQSHDMIRIRKAGFVQWHRDIVDKLDWDLIELEHGKFASDDARLDWLREVWFNLQSGTHHTYGGPINQSGFTPPSSLSKRISESRLLHFKDADNWYAYNQMYGLRNVNESITTSLRHAGHNAGLMEVFGPNPNGLFKKWTNSALELARRNHPEQYEDIANSLKTTGDLNRGWSIVNGEANIPVRGWLAQIGTSIRLSHILSKLGNILISSLPDIGVSGARRAKLGGTMWLETPKQLWGTLHGRPNEEIEEALSAWGLYQKSLISHILRETQFDYYGHPFLVKQTERFFRWTGNNWWQDSGRMAHGLAVVEKLAKQSSKNFADLPANVREHLKLYDITDQDWATLRANLVTVDEHNLIDIASLPERTQRKFENLVIDQAYTGVLESDTVTRGLLLGSSRPGEFGGESRRFLMQFKAYPAALARQVLAKEWNEASSRGEALWRTSQLIAMMTVLGSIPFTLKAILRGEIPQFPWDEDMSASDRAQLLAKYALAGGGGTLYGDFFLKEYRFGGQSAVESAAGPTIALAGELVESVVHSLNINKWQEDPGALGTEWLRHAKSMTPYQNFWLTRWITDPVIFNALQNAMDPGSVDRREIRKMMEDDVEYWLPPTTTLKDLPDQLLPE